MKREFVKREHYIPQFALKYFGNEQGKLPFVNIETAPFKLLFSSTTKLMQERDFYEIKNADGEYILRNSIEDIYSSFESDIGPNYNRFLKLSLKEDFDTEFIKIIKSEEWAEIEASLLMYLVVVLIRGKGVKDITYSKSNLSKSYQHLLHLLMTTSQSKTADFAKGMYVGEELENVLKFIKEDENNAWSVLMNHIMKNYQIRVCRTTGINKFFLSDNPVIIQKFEGEDYILPLSPNLCIILVPINQEGEIWKIDTHIYSLDDEAVNNINKHSILNTDKLIIVSSRNNVKFIESVKLNADK